MKGIFHDNLSMMGKFLEIDAEVEQATHKKPGFNTDRIMINDNLTGTIKTSKSGSNRGDSSSQMQHAHTQRSNVKEIQSASQQLKAQ